MNAPWSAPATVRFIQAWVRLYTHGLPHSLKEARREEIAADLWEQVQEAAIRDGRPPSAHLLLRWLWGLPDDLSWRLAHLRTGETKGDSMIAASNNRRTTIIVGIVSALILLALVAVQGVAAIEEGRGTDSARLSALYSVIFSMVSPLAVVGVVAGFAFMRRGPMTAALVVSFSSFAGAITFYWLFIPFVIAAAVSGFAFYRARRMLAGR